MKYLLDVNVLLAVIWANHSRHAEAFTWLKGKNVGRGLPTERTWVSAN